MFYVYARELLGKLVLKHLTKITLPKSVWNSFGNVFGPNGKFPTIPLNCLISLRFPPIPLNPSKLLGSRRGERISSCNQLVGNAKRVAYALAAQDQDVAALLKALLRSTHNVLSSIDLRAPPQLDVLLPSGTERQNEPREQRIRLFFHSRLPRLFQHVSNMPSVK